jgi:hypothetical protein
MSGSSSGTAYINAVSQVKDIAIRTKWCMKKDRDDIEFRSLHGDECWEFLELAQNFYETELENLLDRVDSAHAARASARTELYQLAGFYIAIQGAIFAASVQTNRLDCDSWWIPAEIDLLLSLCILFGICLKSVDLQREKARYSELQAERNVCNSTLYFPADFFIVPE